MPVDPDKRLQLSVVVTIKNEVNTVCDLLDSLLAQSMRPSEIIVVDGASADGTLEILLDRERCGQISVISKKCNIAEGRNLGIRMAKYPLVACTDAGCKVDKKWVESIIECFSVHHEPDMIAGNFKLIWENDLEESFARAHFSRKRWQTDSAKFFPSSRSVAFKKTAWEVAGGYPEWLYAAEDTLFNVRMRQIGMRFVFCEKAIVQWRPRKDFRSFWRQHFNFGRGNGRIGISAKGYERNIKYHAAILFPLIASFWTPYFFFFSILFAWLHVKAHLLEQSRDAAHDSGKSSMFWRVLLAMEMLRLASLMGWFAGRFDRKFNKAFVTRQQEWMGVSSVDDLKFD